MSWTNSLSSDVTHSVASFLEDHGIRNTRVLVAVSGGVDSVVLLHTLASLSERFGLNLLVAHIHHGLRGTEADDDERFVAAIADQASIWCTTVRVDTRSEAEDSGKGLEAAARRLRYRELERIATEAQAPYVAIAHTADDVAETLLMHLARGSGLDGLAAHAPTRPLGGVHLVRPMIALLRSEVEEFAHQHQITWREDASNADLQFRRNQVRQLIMPAMRHVFGADVGRRMERSTGLLRDARTIIDRSLYELKAHAIHRSDDAVRIDLSDLLDVDAPVAAELIRTAVHDLLGHHGSWTDTQRVRALIPAEVGSKASLSEDVIAVREREQILLRLGSPQHLPSEVVIGRDGAYVAGSERLEVRTQERSAVVIDPDPMILQLDAETVSGTLRWRPWSDGDRFQPFGMDGSQLVSDLLTDRKVPHAARRAVRVLADDEGILWVCGIRAAERSRLTAATETVLSLQLDTLP